MNCSVVIVIVIIITRRWERCLLAVIIITASTIIEVFSKEALHQWTRTIVLHHLHKLGVDLLIAIVIVLGIRTSDLLRIAALEWRQIAVLRGTDSSLG